MSQREGDLKLLADVLKEEITDYERDAFSDMLDGLNTNRSVLSDKQRQWAKEVYEKFVPAYENLVSEGRVPLGKPVPTPAVLLNLPKKPPTRRNA